MNERVHKEKEEMFEMRKMYILSVVILLIAELAVTRATTHGQVKDEFIVYPRKLFANVSELDFADEAVKIELEINERVKVLELRRSKNLIGKHSMVEYVSKQNKSLNISDFDFCYFNGIVRDEQDSCVAVSICNGLVPFEIKLDCKVKHVKLFGKFVAFFL